MTQHPPTPLSRSVTLQVPSLDAPSSPHPTPPHASDWLRSFAASQLDVGWGWGGGYVDLKMI